MYECHPVSADTAARLLIDELIAELAAALERLIEVRDSKADMVDAGTAAIEEFGDGTVDFQRFQKLHRRFTEV